MKIKRFLAPNMREALKAVRVEQGPDAVILSNRRVGDYIEIIAALDYDEALVKQALRRGDSMTQSSEADDAPADIVDDPTPAGPVHDLLSRADKGDAPLDSHRLNDTHITALNVGQDGIEDFGALRDDIGAMRALLHEQVSALNWQRRACADPARAQILRNLTRLGIASDIAGDVCERMEKEGSRLQHPWRAPIAELASALPVFGERLLSEGGVAAFVGPTGVGKTTTIAKIASQFAVRHGARSIALVSMDSFRIGAQEQLRTFGRIINASVFEASDADSLERLLERLDDFKLVLIDTAGVSQRDVRLAKMLEGLTNERREIQLYLTMAATADEHLLEEIVRHYGKAKLTAAVITKIDEACRLGAPMSVLIRHGLPLAYLCDGQRVPDDLYGAERRRMWLMNRALEYAMADEYMPDETLMASRFGHAEVAHG